MQTETSIHRVAKIEICERQYLSCDSGDFFWRRIIVTDVGGNSHTLNLYCRADEDPALEVKSCHP